MVSVGTCLFHEFRHSTNFSLLLAGNGQITPFGVLLATNLHVLG